MNEQELRISQADQIWKVAVVVALFCAGLVLSGFLRYLDLHSENPPQITAYATVIYIAVTVFAAVFLSRSGVPLNRLGFGLKFRPAKYFVLAVAGVALILLSGFLLGPLLDRFVGETRDLSRFADIAGSPAALMKLLILSWTFAAFGEELAFRIVLMRGIAFTLGGSRTALGIALIVQALLFGLVHAYQGPAGVVGAGINGLIFGCLTLAARGSIWPAALAHGASNTVGIVGLYLAG